MTMPPVFRGTDPVSVFEDDAARYLIGLDQADIDHVTDA
jgi:hypothetical protein